ncbi:MAG: type II toxin-antitoxin system PemK/MazF family toxin [Phycisphaerales bacterium]|jgi:mRNA interferase MazF|nr:type II toxin-antitoxin system PemK/MazF family toxin [Phycisphaerales bacterium]
MIHSQGQLWLVNLDPTIGSEIRKTRPAVIVSPDELNEHLRTVIVVPLTTGRAYPFRVSTRVGGKPGVAAVDQLRTVDKRRLVKDLGTMRSPTLKKILDTISDMFAV